MTEKSHLEVYWKMVWKKGLDSYRAPDSFALLDDEIVDSVIGWDLSNIAFDM